MYLISIYFDEQTSHRIQEYINQVAVKTGNTFMLDGKVPPHMTISAFETIHEQDAIKALELCAKELRSGMVQWASVGAFFPYVMYIAPVLNPFLYEISKKVYDCVLKIEDVSISKYYKPLQWMPHTTIAKKLSQEEMRIVFSVLQNQFGVMTGTAVKIGLARTNPYEDLVVFELQKM